MRHHQTKASAAEKGNGYPVAMGYAISWLAVRQEGFATRTAAGWTVIWSNLYAPEICLEAYRDGELLWRVEHDARRARSISMLKARHRPSSMQSGRKSSPHRPIPAWI